MSYVYSLSGIERDELQGGTGETQRIWNITVGESAAIERGMLLGASSPTAEFSLVTSASDVDKVLVIARDDFIADAEHKVTAAYSAGVFNRERIKLGGASTMTLEPFEDALRKSNIILTSVQDKF